MKQTIRGHSIHFDWLTKGRRRFVIDLGNGEEVVFKTFKYFVRVNVNALSTETFGTAVGLMGSYPSGLKLARDNSTSFEDINDFGQEWQVLPGEPKLFHNIEGNQAPMKCVLPTSTTRRLGESSITLEEAQRACALVEEEDRNDW